ncbi:hypothetical protein [Streptomyces parvus]|uniref:hypothetical protein n=1 Tax=Streptomyces parvus TaxID=66428 RepID=UPI0033D68109
MVGCVDGFGREVVLVVDVECGDAEVGGGLVAAVDGDAVALGQGAQRRETLFRSTLISPTHRTSR